MAWLRFMRYLISCFLAAGMALAAPAPSPSPVLWSWAGGVTEDSAVVTACVEKDGAISLFLDEPDGQVRRLEPAHEESGRDGRMVRFELKGLKPDTLYPYSLSARGSALDKDKRTLLTFPREGTPASFRFALGSCARDTDSPVFTAVARQGARFFLHTGDFHYADITENREELFRRAYHRHLAAPHLRAMLLSLPMIYQWDDHDYGSNDSNRTSPSRAASYQNYQHMVPHYAMPVKDADTAEFGGPTDQAFTVGRVRFILSDLRSRRDPAARRMMSPAQDEWLKAELRAAKGRYPLVFWVSSVPWNGPAGDQDRWQGYAAHREEIANFIKAEGITGVCVLSGDAHMTAIDDGTNSDFATGGGAPLRVFQAGPIANRGSYKGGPYSAGARAEPSDTVNGRLYQFGLVDVRDDGSQIEVKWSGRDGADELGDRVLKAQQWGDGAIELSFTVR